MPIDSGTGAAYVAGSSFYDEILRDDYLPMVVDAVINPNELSHLLAMNRDHTSVQGKNVVFPAHTRRNPAVGSSDPGGKLPSNSSRMAQGYDGHFFPTRFMSGRIKLEGILKHASRSDLASWLRILDSETTGMASDMARLRQRQLHGDGTGHLAKVTSVAVNSPVGFDTITVELPDGLESKATCTSAPTQHIVQDMVVGFVLTSGPTLRADPLLVVSVPSTTTFTVVTGSNAVAGDVVVTSNEEGSGATLSDTGYQREMKGMSALFSDADLPNGETGYQGILSSGNRFNQANILDNGGMGRALTELLMQEAFDDAMEIGEANIDCMLASFAMVRTYSDLLTADKRYPNTTELPGGYSAITFNMKPFIADRDAYHNRIAFKDLGNIQSFVLADPQWIDEDGAILSRLDNNYVFQAAMISQENLGSRVRHKNTLLTDLDEK